MCGIDNEYSQSNQKKEKKSRERKRLGRQGRLWKVESACVQGIENKPGMSRSKHGSEALSFKAKKKGCTRIFQVTEWPFQGQEPDSHMCLLVRSKHKEW
jgi:hypothetical protein